MPKSYAEQYKVIDAASMAGDLGQAALNLSAEMQELPPASRGAVFRDKVPGILANTLRVIEVSSFELINDIKHRRAPPQTFTELNQLSLGLSEAEAGRVRGVPISTIKSWRKEIKAYMGTNTRNDTVAEAIQRGLVAIQPDIQPYRRLSWMEERVLVFAASGWATSEIADHFKISANTIDRHYEEIRGKLSARNIPHAIRRGFEVGIFKVGEPISTSTELIDELKVSLRNQSGSQIEIVIDDPREIDLLEKMLRIGDGSLTARQAIEAEGSTEPGKMPHVGRTMLTLARKLEAAAGQPIIVKSRLRVDGNKIHLYRLTTGITVQNEGRQVTLPEYKTSTSSKKVGRPRIYKVPVKRAITPPVQSPEAAIDRPKDQAPMYIPREELPGLDEIVLNARDPADVLHNNAIKPVIRAINPHSLDYRGKIVLFLRYGLDNAAPALINRSGDYVKASTVNVPYMRGLDVASASLVCGLTPLELLKSELNLIRELKTKLPALAEFEENIQFQIEELTKPGS